MNNRKGTKPPGNEEPPTVLCPNCRGDHAMKVVNGKLICMGCGQPDPDPSERQSRQVARFALDPVSLWRMFVDTGWGWTYA